MDEKVDRKRRIPKAVPVVLANLFLERYSTTATSAILVLYLNRKLHFDPSVSTALFHTNELLAYAFTIVGAIIADSWSGLYKTILWMCLVFAIGNAILSIGAIELLNLPALAFTVIGCAIAVIGSGSTRANLIAFGGNQCTPEHPDQLKLYFSLQILSIKSGSLIGRFVNPILKENVQCFGMNDCYPLGFGAPAVAMIIAFLLLLSIRSSCVQKPPEENMLIKVIKCIINGISEKRKDHKMNRKDHWLDYAEARHGSQLVAETKKITRILRLYIPLPIFWALYMQQGSRWIFQATRMDGDLGFYTVTPDQIIALNPLFVIITLPICNYLIYPLLLKVKIETLLQKMTVGGMLAVAAFIIAAFVERAIEKNFINIFWLAPQYLILALSENFLFVSHLNFAYTEAPSSMKSVMTSFVFVVIAIGNLFVVLISSTKIFQSQANEFFFFAGILFIFMIIFGILAHFYEPDNQESTENLPSTKMLEVPPEKY